MDHLRRGTLGVDAIRTVVLDGQPGGGLFYQETHQYPTFAVFDGIGDQFIGNQRQSGRLLQRNTQIVYLLLDPMPFRRRLQTPVCWR